MRFQKKRKWKYRVYEDCRFKLHRRFPRVEHPFFEIDGHNMLIKAGYTFDGPSGPLYDTKKLIFVSLPHDAGYQAIREQLLEECWKIDLDKELEDMYRERTSWGLQWFGSVIYWGVEKFGNPSVQCDIIEVL